MELVDENEGYDSEDDQNDDEPSDKNQRKTPAVI